MDVVVRTIKGESICVLDPANSLRPNLQFIVEETNSEEQLTVLNLNLNKLNDWGVTCDWYQKPTATETILNYRSCSPTQYKNSVIQGLVHTIFRSTSNCQQFDKAMESNKAQWLKNQYPEKWSAKVAADALCEIIESKGASP